MICEDEGDGRVAEIKWVLASAIVELCRVPLYSGLRKGLDEQLAIVTHMQNIGYWARL